MGEGNKLSLEGESLFDHVQILFIDFQQDENHFACCFISLIDQTGQNLEIGWHVRDYHNLFLLTLPTQVFLKGGKADIFIVGVDDRILKESLLLCCCE